MAAGDVPALRRSVYPPKTGRPHLRFAEPGNGCRGPALPGSAFRLPPASPAGAATYGGASRPPGRGGCRRARRLRGTGRRSRSGPRTRSLRSASAWRCFLWRITDNCAIKLPMWRVSGIIVPYKQTCKQNCATMRHYKMERNPDHRFGGLVARPQRRSGHPRFRIAESPSDRASGRHSYGTNLFPAHPQPWSGHPRFRTAESPSDRASGRRSPIVLYPCRRCARWGSCGPTGREPSRVPGGDADQPAERRRGSPAPPRRNQPARDQS